MSIGTFFLFVYLNFHTSSRVSTVSPVWLFSCLCSELNSRSPRRSHSQRVPPGCSRLGPRRLVCLSGAQLFQRPYDLPRSQASPPLTALLPGSPLGRPPGPAVPSEPGDVTPTVFQTPGEGGLPPPLILPGLVFPAQLTRNLQKILSLAADERVAAPDMPSGRRPSLEWPPPPAAARRRGHGHGESSDHIVSTGFFLPWGLERSQAWETGSHGGPSWRTKPLRSRWPVATVPGGVAGPPESQSPAPSSHG